MAQARTTWRSRSARRARPAAHRRAACAHCEPSCPTTTPPSIRTSSTTSTTSEPFPPRGTHLRTVRGRLSPPVRCRSRRARRVRWGGLYAVAHDDEPLPGGIADGGEGLTDPVGEQVQQLPGLVPLALQVLQL